MSEVTGTPPPPGAPPSGEGPKRSTGPRTATDGATSEEHRPPERQAAPETETAKARFDTAVAVSPTLAHLEPGQEVRGDIVRIDGEGRPVLETRDAAYALEPDAGLRKDDHIVILIETVEKRATGRLIERQGVRLETSVRVSLTLLALHHTPEAPADDEAARARDEAAAYQAPLGSAGTGAIDFESSALAIPDSGFPAHGAAPGPALPTPAPTVDITGQAVPAAAPEAFAIAKGKKTPATLTGTLIRTGEQADTPFPDSPGATRIYAQTFGGGEAAAAGNITATPAGQPGAAAASVPTAPPGATPTPTILQPGTQLAARLVAAADGAPARQGLGELKAGDAVTLTILASGAEQAGLAQSQAFIGVIASAQEIAASAKDTSGLGLVLDAGEESDAPVQKKTGDSNPAEQRGERRAAARTGARSDKHYITTPAGAFLFHAVEKIAIGTKVTLTATPGVSDSLRAGGSRSVSGPVLPGAQVSGVEGRASATSTSATETPSQTQPVPPPAAQTAAQAAAPQALPPLVSYQAAWPLVDEVIEAVNLADPAAAKSLAPRISAPGARLSSGLLFFISALRMQNPRAWIGERAAKALEAKGKGALLNRLGEEFTRLGRFSADTPGADWRPFLIPLQTEHGTQAIALLTRPHQEESDGAPRDDGEDDDEELTENQRFLLEVKLSALGPLQLDGLMRPERLDMVVRAGDMLNRTMRDELRHIFESATRAAGLEGGLSFEPLSRSPVDVARVLANALPDDHDARTLA